MAAPATVHSAQRSRAVASAARIVFLGVDRIQRGDSLGRQRIGPDGIHGIDYGGNAGFDLVEGGPLTDRRFGQFVALKKRIAFQFFVNEGINLDI
jgi:hypothetical protein